MIAMNLSDLTIQYVDYPPAGQPRGYYITAPEYEEIMDGPFATLSDAEKAFHEYTENYEPHDPPGWEGGFAENH